MRAIGVAVGMAPRIVSRTCDRHLELNLLVIGSQVVVTHRPIDGNAVFRVHAEVRRVQPRRKGRPVYGTTANATTAIVGAEGQRMLAAGDAEIFPVELVRTGLIADPVALTVPEGPGLKTNHIESRPCQSLQQNSAG